MYTIDLTYVGRGLHEELVAYIADSSARPSPMVVPWRSRCSSQELPSRSVTWTPSSA